MNRDRLQVEVEQIETSPTQHCNIMSDDEITPELANKKIKGPNMEDEKQKVVNDRLTEFVVYFVYLYTSSMDEYYYRLVNKIGKPGQVANFFNKVIKIGKCGAEDKANYIVGFNILQEVISSYGIKHNMKNVKKLKPLINKFKEDLFQSKKELIKAGINMFQCFESQFVQATADKSWKYAMQKLAHDAVSRANNYYKENTDEVFSADSITKGIIKGQSKRYKHTTTFIFKFRKGHTLQNENSITWNTAKLFEEAGLVTITSDGTTDKYYKRKDGNNTSNNYGYRLLFNWEPEDLITTEYDEEEENHLTEEYKYILKSNEELESILLNKINNQGKVEDNVEKYVKQIKQATEESFKKIVKCIRYYYDDLLNYLVENIDKIREDINEMNQKLEKMALENKNEFEKASQEREKIENRARQERKKIENKISQEGEKITTEFKIEFENTRAAIALKGKQNKIITFGIRNLVKPFIGRKNELDNVNTIIYNDGTIVVIGGLDGVGKSELARKFAHKQLTNNSEYNVIWINAETPETAKDSFRELLKREFHSKTSDLEEKSVESMAYEVYGHDRFSGKTTLFIFDNAENYLAVQNILPLELPNNANKFYILVTSRNQDDWNSDRRTKIEVQSLSDFTPEEAKEFIKTALYINNDFEDADIKKLVKRLSNFPLALQQAVAFIKEKRKEKKDRGHRYDYNVKNYLKDFKQAPRKLLNVKLPDDEHLRSIIKTLEVLLNKIEGDKDYGKEALNMLYIMAYLAPTNIPEEIFLNNLASNDQKFWCITSLLKKYYIVNLNSNNKKDDVLLDKNANDNDETIHENVKVMWNIHGLVQQVVRLILNKQNEEETVLKATLKLLKEQMIDRESAESYLPHIISVWDHASKYNTLIKSFIVDDIDDKNAYTSYFHLITQGSNYEIVKAIISEVEMNYSNKLNVIINAKNKDMGTPLHNAALGGDERITKLLIDKSADVNAKKNNDWTPLLLAACNNRIGVIKALLDNNADVEATTNNGNSSLHFATNYDNLDIVEAIINKVELNYSNKLKEIINAENEINMAIPLHNAAVIGDIRIINLLVGKGAEINAKKKCDFSPLHCAVKYNKIDAVKTLLDKNADVNAKTKLNYTPLHFAAKNNNLGAIEALLNKNAKLDIQTNKGFTALHFAVKNEHLDIVRALLQKGAGVNIQNKKFDTPLHLASDIGNVEVVNELLKDGKINVNNVQRNKKNTALHFAAGNGSIEIVKALIAKNADFNIKNAKGETALDAAERWKQIEVENYILRQICKPHNNK